MLSNTSNCPLNHVPSHFFQSLLQAFPILSCEQTRYCCRFLRMSPERFEHLAELTRPYLTKRCWNREVICPKQRLAITLRYLATGNTQASESFNFVVSVDVYSKNTSRRYHDKLYTTFTSHILAKGYSRNMSTRYLKQVSLCC